MKSLLFVQNGDYREAYLRFEKGDPETYRDQRRSVEHVAGFAPNACVTTVAFSREAYRQELAPNLWAVGLPRAKINAAAIARIFEQAAPTHVLQRTPHVGFLREARRRHLPVLPTFADIFRHGGPRTTIGNFLMRRELLKSHAPCFSNHSLNASRSLVQVLRLPADKIIPWDWSRIPVTASAKTGVTDVAKPTAFFAGHISEAKGVGDCLRAVAEMKKRGTNLSISLAGSGNLEEWNRLARNLGVSDQVKFIGLISNKKVREEMHAHDFVIVPSRHEYAEGLPNTIYEGLASRSVLVVSDHPAFAGRLVENKEVLVFEASNPKSLADCLGKVIKDNALYGSLSANSAAAHERLYVGMEWTTLIDVFLEDPTNKRGWVEKNILQGLVA